MDARNGISFPGFKWVDYRTKKKKKKRRVPEQLFFFLLGPTLPIFKFFNGNGFILQENETEDQEVGSKDGIVDAWYEAIN